MAKKVSVDKVIDQRARETLQEELQKMNNEDEDHSMPEEKFISSPLPPVEFTEDAEDKLDSLLDGVTREEGYRVMLYKKNPLNNKFELKLPIEDWANWDNAEYEVWNLVSEKSKQFKGWGSGTYQLMVFKHGRDGFRKRPAVIDISIDEPIVDSTRVNDLQGKLSETVEIVKAAQQISPQNIAAPSGDMTKNIAEAFKQGIEVMKTAIPVGEKSAREADPVVLATNMMTAMIGAMSTMMSKIQMPTSDHNTNTDSLKDAILLLKELGMTKNSKDDDPINKFAQMKEIFEMFKGFSGEGGGEAPSLLSKAIDVIGPRVPEMIENITGAVRSVAETSKAKLAASMERAPTYMAIPSSDEMPVVRRKILAPPGDEAFHDDIPPFSSIERTAVSHQSLPVSEPTNGGRMNPVVKEIFNAVQANNQAFFPRLHELMKLYVSPVVIEQLVNGQMQIDTVLDAISKQVNEPFLVSQQSKDYFTSFVRWASDMFKPISAKCTNCGVDDYEFPTRKEWDAFDKKCEECGGTLEETEKAHVGTA